MRPLLLFLALMGCARPPAAPMQGAPPPLVGAIAAHTPLAVQLDRAITAHNDEVGARWSATFVRDVRDARGQVVIPAGAKLEGTITTIVSGDADFPGRIELGVERIRAGASVHPISGRMVSSELEDEPRRRTPERFDRSLMVGTLIGTMMLGINGAGVGLVGGATTGAALAVERFKWRDAVLEGGSFITVELDRPVRVYDLF